MSLRLVAWGLLSLFLAFVFFCILEVAARDMRYIHLVGKNGTASG
jgi:hypothetical protein